MSRFAVALAVVASAAVVVSAAFADPPTRLPTGNGPFTLSGLCSFDVQVTPLVDNEYTITFSDGATIITGRLVERLTNATTAKSLVVTSRDRASSTRTGPNSSSPGRLCSSALRHRTDCFSRTGWTQATSRPATS